MANGTRVNVKSISGLKIEQITYHVISGPFPHIINSTLVDEYIFPSAENVACVTSALKKTDRLNKENYRLISVLNVF